MKISEAITKLAIIKTLYGDLTITGGHMNDSTPLGHIMVTDIEGMEVWPRDPNCVAGENKIDGVFFE
jgi:hypothetical protein